MGSGDSPRVVISTPGVGTVPEWAISTPGSGDSPRVVAAEWKRRGLRRLPMEEESARELKTSNNAVR